MRRRSFLKIAGLGVAGAVGVPVAEALTEAVRAERAPTAAAGKPKPAVVKGPFSGT